MEATLTQIVSKIAEIPPDFPRDAHLRDDLNVDSFRAVEIVFEVERTFAIKVPDGRYGQVQTFKDLLELVETLKAG